MSEMSAEIHRRQLEDIAELAGFTVEELLDQLEPYPLREWAAVLRELIPGVVINFGTAAAVLGVDYYNSRRALIMPKKATKAESAFQATLDMIPQTLIDEGLNKSLNYFVSQIFQKIEDGVIVNAADAEKAVEYLSDIQPEEIKKITEGLTEVVKTNTLDFSRKTIDAAAELDPAPIKKTRSVNKGGCNWCKLLHARGYIKEPKYKPLIPLGDVTGHFHENCRCTVDIAYGEVVPPLWYEEWFARYRSAAGKLGTTEKNAVVSELRRMDEEDAKKD